jgi:hypothetical protein
MRGGILYFFIFYGLGAYLVYYFAYLRGTRRADPDGNDRAALWLITLFWPVMLIPTISSLFNSGSEDQAYPGKSRKSGGQTAPEDEYNDMTFGERKGDEPEDMEVFIQSLAQRPDMPLPHELTFSYKLTGISKIYPAGTMFPSSLIRDWRRGYFMGQEMNDN